MGYDEQGLSEFAGNLPEQIKHDLTIFLIQITRRFIAHDDQGIVDEGPGDGYTLFLTAGQLVGFFECLIFDAEDPHAYDDVVFGAVGSLLRTFEDDGKGGVKLHIDLRMEPGETRVPKCPIP